MSGGKAATISDPTPPLASLGRGENLHSPEFSVLVAPTVVLDLRDTKVMGHWHWFPMDGVWSNLGLWEVSLAIRTG